MCSLAAARTRALDLQHALRHSPEEEEHRSVWVFVSMACPNGLCPIRYMVKQGGEDTGTHRMRDVLENRERMHDACARHNQAKDIQAADCNPVHSNVPYT